MEDVGSVAVHLDAFHFLRENIPGDVWAAVDYKNRFAAFVRLMGEYGAEKAGADDQIIVHYLFPNSKIFII